MNDYKLLHGGDLCENDNKGETSHPWLHKFIHFCNGAIFKKVSMFIIFMAQYHYCKSDPSSIAQYEIRAREYVFLDFERCST